VHEHPARFKVLAAGRRWGKTRLGVNQCIDVASRGGRAWWVAPSYKMGRVGWRPLARIGARIGAEVRQGDQQVLFRNGGEVCVRSADDPQSLRGEGLDFVVLDECAFMQEATWGEVLRPALSDRLGQALFISTPKGRNWFWRAWASGQAAGDEWMSWQFPTANNPYIDAIEIEAARLSLPDRVFRQEYLAEFIDDAGGVFRNVIACATATATAPYDGQFVYGVDWGKHSDFTVISVLDMSTRQMVAMDRFNQIDYAVQVGRLKALAERYRPTVIIAERNSMGEPLIEMLQRDDMPVRAFTTSNASKAQIVDGLALAFERGDVGIINDPVLIGELQAYEMERLPSGMLRYSAPDGMHDDCVMSLALAWHGCATTTGGQIFY
jgi:phage terminase large subunit-like protein